MAKKTIVVDLNVSYQFAVKFDDESLEFKQALSDFQEVIDSNSDVKKMIGHCLYQYALRGTRDIEGVGTIAVDGLDYSESQNNFPFSGISVVTVWDEEVEYNMEEIRTCRVCGCTDDTACQLDHGPCEWVEQDLCSNPDCLAKSIY